jgi:hypothetical protein
MLINTLNINYLIYSILRFMKQFIQFKIITVPKYFFTSILIKLALQ